MALGGDLRTGQSRCPAHDDIKPSLSIAVVDGLLLFKCHAGCEQEAVLTALREAGLWPKVTSPVMTIEQIAPAPTAPPLGIQPTRIYEYRDEQGRLLYETVRTDNTNGTKEIRQRRPTESGKNAWNLDGVRRVLYNLPEVLRANTVHIVEGEKCAEALEALGFVATTNVGGAGKWRDDYTQTLHGKAIIVHSDNDEPGVRHTAAVCCSLFGKVTEIKVLTYKELPAKADVSDWIEAGGTAEQLADRVAAAKPLTEQEIKGLQQATKPLKSGAYLALEPHEQVPTVVWMNDVVEQEIHWLWKPYIAHKKLTMLDGDPGLGKSTVTVDIAAHVTRGEPMGGILGYSQPREPMNVLFVATEDDLADTVKPRLRAARADMSRIANLMEVPMGKLADGTIVNRPVMFPDDEPLIRRIITENNIGLVVIDPVMNHINPDLDSHKDQQVRTALGPLNTLAQQTGVAIIAVRHLTKTVGGSAIYRGGGSIGFIGLARSGLMLTRDPEDHTKRILSLSKSNNSATENRSLRFSLSSNGKDEPPRIVWEGFAVGYTADNLVNPAPRQSPAQQEAEEFFREVLASGPKPTTEVEQEALDRGISRSTFDRVRLKVCGKAIRGTGDDKRWYIELRDRPGKEAK